jgi:hypothetical protein
MVVFLSMNYELLSMNYEVLSFNKSFPRKWESRAKVACAVKLNLFQLLNYIDAETSSA